MKCTDLVSAAVVFGATKATETASKQICPNGSEWRHQHIKTKVEFFATYQKGRFDVLWNDIGFARWCGLLRTTPTHRGWLNGVTTEWRWWIPFIWPLFDPWKLRLKKKKVTIHQKQKSEISPLLWTLMEYSALYLGDKKDPWTLRASARFHDPSTCRTASIFFRK